MLYRKIAAVIEEHLTSASPAILLIDGARQIGKTYIIRYVGKRLYSNFIEINMVEDSLGPRLFAEARTTEDFYLRLSMIAGDKMNDKNDTLVFIDEIQAYPFLLTLLKFLRDDDRFTYIASGSLLGVALAQSPSIPLGSVRRIRMFPLDFEEFLYANGLNATFVAFLKEKFRRLETLDEATHRRLLDLFRKYLLIGGMPGVVVRYLATKNIRVAREIQNEIREYYAADAAKIDAAKRLRIRRVYDLIPSNMENKKKRVVAREIENKKGKTFSDYREEFDYLIGAGVVLDVRAVANPTFPLLQSAKKNLLKLYLNDVGLLTALLYGDNARAILDDELSVNLGSVYETVVAGELIARGRSLYYYDNRRNGEVDFLIDDYETLSVAPIEVKSGKDYTIHSALNKLTSDENYGAKKAYVLSNERRVFVKNKIVHLPIYDAMFL